jgi:hypothetical protein
VREICSAVLFSSLNTIILFFAPILMNDEFVFGFDAGSDAFSNSELLSYTSAELDTWQAAGLQVLQEAPVELALLRTLFGVSGVRAEPTLMTSTTTSICLMKLACIGYQTIRHPTKLLRLAGACAGIYDQTVYQFVWDRKQRKGFIGIVDDCGPGEEEEIPIRCLYPGQAISLNDWFRLFLSVPARKILEIWELGCSDLKNVIVFDQHGKFIGFEPLHHVDLVLSAFQVTATRTASIARVLSALGGEGGQPPKSSEPIQTCQIELMGCACGCALRGDAYLPACYCARLEQYGLPSVQLPGRVYVGQYVHEALRGVDVLNNLIMQFVSTHD